MTHDGELTARVKAEAQAAGFARVGVAEAGALDEEAAHLDAWLADGRHGQMSWMAQTASVRKDPRDPNMLEHAKSVIVMAAPYARRNGYEGPPPARIAKYAVGRDYHNVLTKKSRKVARVLQEAGFAARVAVDSKPVFERAWAERAGIGFVGKNCCLIVPGVGSHAFLACVVTTAPLTPAEPMGRRCGSCSLCLDACPTRAFSGPRSLDARKCISYLTIEHRGAIPAEHRRALGPWAFGCDVCQDVCPYNQASGAADASLDAFEAGERWVGVDAARLLQMTEEEFRAWAQGSPVKRAQHEGLARNVALVLGNRGEELHLPVLDDARRNHPSEVVREAAEWASIELNRRLAVSE
ncbi:MAG: tRNA epoxyqueuosine(34) reductase QueG [Deltaproteobacteria bacterium]|jgi:epoxyqueuosine reductase|nr:tRNA epoxyqueuosine(34) reductase QueG [Deltaproteobacteria bacterium]MBW1874745.1 tRNA epoxyqueuosine(34) reductase QueG [Deltaproteobacteria bacterium]MBW2210620.1 tRNA epoxyqueuosine(34) reductase QueG [Deltaproteobacteria bacterium]MBW2214102.1 tRNA epoxyqueuosine(34) reductase QueG [Deltaproteobacteria bacterium]MBW2380283.1 tRNA epoxyqueuosine(34) reductase QueG [Deltaproteobacteria bacterium]